MTADAGAIDQSQREVSPWRAVGLFVLLTACLSGIFWALINATQTVNAAYIFGLMWMPAVAAILTCRILRRPLRTLGLGTWNGRYVLIGYLIPIAYCLVASLGIWIFGFGAFPNTDFVRQTAEAFGVGGAPHWVVIAMFVVLTGTTGMFTGVAVATGEEIGWRGFLVPALASGRRSSCTPATTCGCSRSSRRGPATGSTRSGSRETWAWRSLWSLRSSRSLSGLSAVS
jgi:uncharacterized protein